MSRKTVREHGMASCEGKILERIISVKENSCEGWFLGRKNNVGNSSPWDTFCKRKIL